MARKPRSFFVRAGVTAVMLGGGEILFRLGDPLMGAGIVALGAVLVVGGVILDRRRADIAAQDEQPEA